MVINHEIPQTRRGRNIKRGQLDFVVFFAVVFVVVVAVAVVAVVAVVAFFVVAAVVVG